jgi:NAD-dependent histone deacetylase SIR2
MEDGATAAMSSVSSPLSSPRSSQLSSPLSSAGSRSPTPPVDYPSPNSCNESEIGALSEAVKRSAPRREGDEPPPKRQKIVKWKGEEKTTEYLNLPALNESCDEADHKIEDAKLRKLTEVLRSKRKIVVIAGAGISVSAGSMPLPSNFTMGRNTNLSVVPDFRSSTGLFTTLRGQHKLKSSGKELFDASVYKDDRATSSFHDMVRELSHRTKQAKPTPFHHMLATLAEEGRLLRLYSQNVDGIDTSLEPLKTNVPLNTKGPWPKTIQLHGGLEKMVCTKCKSCLDFDGALFEGSEPPDCPVCTERDTVRVAGGLRSHGIGRLRPRMVLYNEFNPDGDAIGAVSEADLKTKPDAVIVVGTTLKIPGTRRLAREMCQLARDRRGGFTAWINLDQPPSGVDLKDCWDMVVTAECDDIARYVGLPQWNDKDCGEYKMVEGQKEDAKGLVGVVVDSKPVDVVKNQGILTPTDSPRHQSPTPLVNTAKMKQPKLFFDPDKKVELTKAGKPKKKPGRKVAPKDGAKDGRKPLPNSKPKNIITNAFTATKSKTAVSKPAKSVTPDLKMPNVAPGTPMGVVSPFDARTNIDIRAKSVTPVVEIPNYKSSAISPAYDRQETISPKGKLPHGMEDLLS